MVAVVSGNSLGLFSSSRNILGGGGGSDRVFVNSATGNLILQERDETLAALGIHTPLVRTYNSQGLLDDDNADNWRLSSHQRLQGLTGTVNSTGSTITKLFGDGAAVIYMYDAAQSHYVSPDGDGAHDTLTYDSGTSEWTWTDGSARNTETYDASGRLTSSHDQDGNALVYTYTGNLLTLVTDASGQQTYFDYSGAHLTAVRVVSNAVTQTLTRYTYDATDRLETVTVDLSPEDNSVADGKKFVTTYTYDGSSKRVATISQGDGVTAGSTVGFTYQLLDGAYRVKTFTDGESRITTYAYSSPSTSSSGTTYLQTDVTDPLGLVTSFITDTNGRLLRVLSATTGGARLERRYAYDSAGNVTSVTDDPAGLNRVTTFEYDANGNLTLTRDAAGNTLTRTYSATNQVLTETRYLVPDADGAGSGQPSGALTTRYAYDSEGHLRFVVSADGRVTENRYSSSGLVVATLQYTDAFYDVTALAATAALTESQLVTWAAARDLQKLQRVDYEFDFRGNLSVRRSYRATDASGAGVASTASVTRSTYDQRGQLILALDARSEATPGDSTDYATTYTYDGLGRLLTTSVWIDSTHISTTTNQYDDAQNRTVTTLANGLVTTSLYDRTGSLLSAANVGPGSTPLGTTTYKYDADGRLRYVTDPTGVRQHTLYDEAGRKVATVDGDGTLTEFVYDKASEPIKTVVYATRLSPSAIASLVDSSGNPTSVTLSTLRPSPVAQDRITRTVFDAAGRQVYAIDEVGAVTQLIYDGAGRIVDEVRFATPFAIARATDEVLPSAVTVTTSANDRRTRHFYDNAGNQVATLDAAGYLVEMVYDAAGRLTRQIAYADATPTSFRATGTLAQLRPAADNETAVDPERDIVSYFFYDNQGRRTGVLDAEGYLTETSYDVAGNVAQTTRYDFVLTYSAGVTVDDLRGNVPGTAARHTATFAYDGSARLTQETNYEGTSTQYSYDAVGKLTSVTRASGATEARTTQTRYDALGRVIAELTAEGSALITGGMTQVQIDAIWNQYAVRYAYDLAGRRISATDQNGYATLFYYDTDGRQTQLINAEGEVTETTYDARGRITGTRKYNAQISTSGLTGGLVNSTLTSRLVANNTLDARTTTTYAYTATGQESTTTTAEGAAVTHRLNAFGDETTRLEQIDATTQRQHTYQYDALGHLTQTVWLNPSFENRTETRQYDAFGRVARSTDQYGNISKTEYDRFGRVIATVDPLTNRRTSTYDAFDRLLTTTDALNHTTLYAYNDAARSVTVTTPEGISVVTVHNRHLQALTVTDGRGGITTFAYDENGQLETASDGLGSLESRVYDRAGREITTTDGRGTVTTFGYDAVNRILTRTVDSASGGLALTTTYVYDDQGRVKDITDPAGTLTRTDYDRDGRVTAVTVDPNGPARTQTTYSYDLTGNVLTVTEGAGSSNPRRTKYIYDALGRRIEEIVDPTALGGTLNLRTQYRYDANGNVTRKIDARGYSTWYVYDAGDRLRYTIDALGGVSETTYDAEERVSSTRRYATAITPPSATTDRVTSVTVATSTLDRREQHVYDNDGREVFVIDSLGGVAQKEYDASGNVVRQRFYSERIATGTYTTPAAVTAALALVSDGNATNDREARSIYDARNRVAFEIDGAGSVIRNEYDGAGGLIARTAFATQRPEADLPNLATLQAWASSHAIGSDDRTTRTWFDGGGRIIFTRDEEGYLHETRYDGAGRVSEEIAYFVAPALSATAAVSDVRAAIVANTQHDQHTVRVYDAAGRLRSTTDAEGKTESYTYDAVGNRLTVTNKKNAVWTSVYDANGRVTEERGPPVEITSVTPADSGGTPSLVSATSTASIVTRTQYDALGNVTSRTEAYGTSQARTLVYTYDALGRQVGVFYPRVDVYSGSWLSAYVDRLDPSGFELQSILTAVDLFSQTTYDTLGNAIGNVDLARTQTFKVYDMLGRVRFAVDGERYVTEYRYDSFGNQIQLIRYANKVQPAAGFTGPITGDYLVSRLQPDPARDRTILTSYDRLDRVQQVTQPAGVVFEPNAGAAGGKTFVAGATTVSVYSAQGQLTKQSTLVDPIEGTWADTYFYYDRRGLKTAEVDALGHVTTYQYDATGNCTGSTEYANPLQSGQWHAAGYSLPVANDADRAVEYTYDRLNRKTSERQLGITYSSVSGSTLATYAGDRVTSFGYDVLGNQTRITDANGASTFTYYDALGRQIATAAPSRDPGNGSALTPLTRTRLDARGNVVELVTYAAGASTATETAFTATTGAQDRTTRVLMDALDRAVRTQDPTGVTRFAAYNARGQLAREWQNIAAAGATPKYAVTVYGYDALGQQTQVIQQSADDGYHEPAGWKNGGGETGDMTGWIVTSGDMRVRADQPDREPPEGTDIIDGGTSARSTAYQRIDLLASGVSTDSIDGGTASILCDWWGGAFIQSPADQPQINFIFRDANGALIGTYSSGYKNPSTAIGTMLWSQYRESAGVPPMTRYIDVELDAKRNNGTNNDAAFDNVRPRIVTIPQNIYTKVEYNAFGEITRKITKPHEDLGYDLVSHLPSGWVNGGAETGNMTGWTVTAGNPQVRANQPDRAPREGANIFDGGSSARSTAHQRINLVASGVTAADIDAGRATMLADWWGGTFTQSPADQPQLNFLFRDASGALIGTYNSGFKNPSTVIGSMSWSEYHELASIPAGTRFIDVQMDALRNGGTNNDAAFDNIRPRIVTVNPEAAPDDFAGGEYFEYDQAGRLSRTNTGDGVEKVYLYNLAGQATAEIKGQTLRTETRYDLLGRQVEVRQPRFVQANPNSELQNIGGQLRVDDNVLGPSNPDAVYRLVGQGYDYGIDAQYYYTVPVLDPNGGGYYFIAPTASNPAGGWVQDPSYHLATSRYIHWARPADFVTSAAAWSVTPHFQYRVANGAWIDLAVAAMPNGEFGVNVGSLAGGNYEYRLTYTRANELQPYAQATGTLALGAGAPALTDTTAATLAAANITPTSTVVDVPINTQFRDAHFQIGDVKGIGIDPYVYRRVVTGSLVDYVVDRSATVAQGGGYYLTATGYVQKTDYTPLTSRYVYWNAPTDSTLIPTFEYRSTADATAEWHSIAAGSLPNNRLGAAIGDLESGGYEFRVTYTHAGDATVIAQATGAFRVDPTLTVNDLSLTADLPDDLGHVASISNRPPGSTGITAQVTSSSTADHVSAGELYFTGANDVLLKFPSITGQVRVELEYTTRAYTPTDGSTQWPSTSRTISVLVANASGAASGIHVNWRDPDGLTATGGVDHITNVRVYSVANDGTATLAYSTDAGTTGAIRSTALSWAAPWEAGVVATFNVRPAGATTWQPMTINRVGGDFTVDTAALGNGHWEYQVTYTQNGVQRAAASGTFVVSGGGVTNVAGTPSSGIEPVGPVSATGTAPVEFTVVHSTQQTISGTPYDTTNGVTHNNHPLTTGWSGSNQVDLTWADVGTGPVRVQLDYTSASRYAFNFDNVSGSPHWEATGALVPGQSASKTFDLTSGATGGSVTWTDSAASLIGGIDSISRVRVYTQDGSGNWVLRYDRDTAAPVGGKSVYWPAPDDTAISTQFQIRAHGTTTWQTLTVSADSRGHGYAALDSFANGDYDYQVTYTSGATVTAVAAGLISIRDSATTATAGHAFTVTQSTVTFDQGASDFGPVFANGRNLSWTRAPVANDTIVLRYREPGQSTWQTQTVSGSGPDFTVTLPGSGNSALEFQVQYIHQGDSVAYAQAGGTFDKPLAVAAAPATIYTTQTATTTSDRVAITDVSAFGGVISWTTKAEAGATVQFRYLLANGTWQTLPVQPVGDNGYGVDQRVLLPGTYRYEVNYLRSGQTVPYAYASGSITIGRQTSGSGQSITDTTSYVKTSIEQTAAGIPTVVQTFDRWGRLVSTTDAAGNTTNYRYNKLGELVQTLMPQVQAVSTTGGTVTATTLRPETDNYYDLLGRLIATRDADGNVTSVTYNAAGQVTTERHADSGVKSYVYDVFGNRIESVDELGYHTRSRFDANDNLIVLDREIVQGAIAANDIANFVETTYTYSGLGEKLTETDGTNALTSYEYSVQGDLTLRRTAMGKQTIYRYDHLGRKTYEQDPNGNTQSWQYDYFGRMVSHTDMGGVTYRYAYNELGLLVRQTSSAGQNQVFEYDAAGHLTRIVDHGTPTGSDGAGRVATNRLTEYGYDIAGRRITERTTIDGRTQQNTVIQYDALGRIIDLQDVNYHTAYSYDAAGNRTRINSSYYNHSGYSSSNLQTQDLWYTYDAMNRVLVSQGVNSSGTIGITTSQGIELTYNQAGERKSARTAAEHIEIAQTTDAVGNVVSTTYQRATGLYTERYDYDGLGRLTNTDEDAAVSSYNTSTGQTTAGLQSLRLTERTYDKASRETTEVNWTLEQNSATTLTQRSQATTYDADGLTQTQTFAKNGQVESVVRFGYLVFVPGHYEPVNRPQPVFTTGNTTGGNSNPFMVWVPPSWQGTGYDQAGVLRSYLVESYQDGQLKLATKYSLTYRQGDTYQQVDETAHSEAKASGVGVPTDGKTTRIYDVNGDLVQITDTKDATKNRYFANSAFGQALAVVQGNYDGQSGRLTVAQAFDNALVRTGNQVKGQYFFFANGQMVGSFGQLQTADGSFKANFDINYTAISDGYPSSVPSQVIVQSGDTLRSIAARVFGDPNLWYVIADENGLTDPDAALAEGTQLRIPNDVVSLSNQSTSFRPFDAADAIGDTTPTQPAPPAPRRKKGCGVVGQILVIIVVIIVTIYTAGLAAGASGALGSTLSAGAGAISSGSIGVAGGAIAGAAGSVAGQAVGLATGVQDKFSFKDVGLAAVGGGVSAGLAGSSAFGGAVGTLSQGNSYAAAAISAASSNALTQGASVVLGLQSKFDWRSVAMSAVTAPLAQAASDKAGAWASGSKAAYEGAVQTGTYTLGRFAADAAGTITSAGIRSALGGKFDVVQVSTDVFGNALANSIVQKLRTSPSAVADQIASSIQADMAGRLSKEKLAELSEFEKSAAARIREARRLEATDGAAADQVLKGILNDALGFYPEDEAAAARALTGPFANINEVGDVVVTGQEELGRAFGLFDRPAVYAGRLKERVDGEIESFIDKTPGAGLALNVINWGMIIAGGPVRYLGGEAYGMAHDKIQDAATQRFTDAEYVDNTARPGGAGAMWLGDLAITGFALLLKRRNANRPDYQPTKPSGVRGDIDANLSGTRSKEGKVTTWKEENEVGELFAKEGYRVEQNPTLSAAQREHLGIPDRDPDYLIEGRPFDLYSPKPDTALPNVHRSIAEKTLPSDRQADRVIVDLRDSSVSRTELEKYVRQNPISGLNELRVITTDWLGRTVIQTVRR